MTRRKVVLVLMGVAGLVLYLWPAISAPVVLWSDSEVDLRWARQGIGLWKPFPAEEARGTGIHPPKPGYLLFLRLASAALPFVGATRSIVIVQSALLWTSIAATCMWLGRRRGLGVGCSAYAMILLFIPLRDSASAVMPEAISTALFLPLCAAAIEVPQRRREAILAGVAVVVLFWIRPNVGVVAVLTLVVGWALSRAFRSIGWALAVLLPCLVGLWLTTQPYGGSDPARGLSAPILFGSADYAWAPSLGSWPAGPVGFSSDPRLVRAAENWRRMWSGVAPDRNRQLRWRALHGFFGIEYYDPRWSPLYRTLDHALRLIAPFLVLAGLATALDVHSRRNKSVVAIAWTLFPALVVHDLLFASNFRLLLPFLPGILLLGAAAVLARSSDRLLFLRAAVVFLLAVLFLARYPESTSWDWGKLERAGVIIDQRIPLGGLPRRSPATLHIRIAPPGAQSPQLLVQWKNRTLYRSSEDPFRERPQITIPLPQEILEENARSAVILRLTSFGGYGPDAYLQFAVIPPPWRSGAHRLDAAELSPGSGIASGALDWWAHPGLDSRVSATGR